MANRQTLRDDVRDTVSESSENLSDNTLNRMISMATAKLTRDMLVDGMPKPRQMLAHITLTTDTEGKIALPTDWGRARSVKSGDTLYKYLSSERIKLTGTPTETDFEVNYYQQLPALDDVTSNWLLDLALDLYIYAACLQYAPWAKENGGVYDGFYRDGLQSLCNANSTPPTGGMLQQKAARHNGYYTIYGTTMVFGTL